MEVKGERKLENEKKGPKGVIMMQMCQARINM